MDNPTIEPAGFVYLISCAETNIVKIGYSLNPQRRLETLQSANPSKLTLQGAWPGTMQREQYIHRELRQFRISGEWFYLSAPTVLAKMTELLATELKDERFTKCFAPENPDSPSGWKRSQKRRGWLIKRIGGYNINENLYGVTYLYVLQRHPDKTSANAELYPDAGFKNWKSLEQSGLLRKEKKTK